MEDFSQVRFIKESSDVYISSAKDVYNYLKENISKLDREYFFVIHLDTKGKIISVEIVSIGNLNSTVVHPREVFKTAILNNTHAIILAHNHPSGDPSPSKEDLAITERLISSGELLGIEVKDHVILGKDLYFSV
jgi:DNA repair protein RadC